MIFGFVIGALRGSVPHVPERAALVVAPEGGSSSSSPAIRCSAPSQEARGEGHAETLLWDLTDVDPRRGQGHAHPVLVLELDNFEGGGQPTLEELARALREFRASGKKVIAYGTELTAGALLPRRAGR